MKFQLFSSPALARTARTLAAQPPARRACPWAAPGILAVLAFGPQPVEAAVTEGWVQRYSDVGGTGNDETVAAVCDALGDIIVAARIEGEATGRDLLTIKYSGADGSVLWQHRHHGPLNQDDYRSAVAVDGRCNVVVTRGSRVAAGDSYTAKYAAADGALLWEKRRPGGGAAAVAVDRIGNVVATGTSTTAKYAAADGALLWAKHHRQATAVAVDGVGNVLVTGLWGTAKFAAANGARLWEKSFQDTTASAVAVDANGDVVVTGTSNSSHDGWYYNNGGDYYTAKYAGTDGALLWEHRYNGPTMNTDAAKAMAVDGRGNVVVTGTSFGADNFGSDYYTAKYAAADGALLWEQRGLGPEKFGFASGMAVAVDSSGNAVVTGRRAVIGGSSGGGSDSDYYTAKYAAADGTLLWEKRYNGPANGKDNAFSLALGPNGLVCVTGCSIGSSGRCDIATVVYRDPAP